MNTSKNLAIEACKRLLGETKNTAKHVAEIVRMFPTILEDHIKALERIDVLEAELEIKNKNLNGAPVNCNDCFHQYRWGDLKCRKGRDEHNTLYPVVCSSYYPKVTCAECVFLRVYESGSCFCAESLDHGHHRCTGGAFAKRSCEHFKRKPRNEESNNENS